MHIYVHASTGTSPVSQAASPVFTGKVHVTFGKALLEQGTLLAHTT